MMCVSMDKTSSLNARCLLKLETLVSTMKMASHEKQTFLLSDPTSDGTSVSLSRWSSDAVSMDENMEFNSLRLST